MTYRDTDEGTIEALLQRITTQVLPKVLKIKEKVDNGEKLNDYEVDVLLQIYERNKRNRGIFHRHPEYDLFETELMALYAHVINDAVENEKV